MPALFPSVHPFKVSLLYYGVIAVVGVSSETEYHERQSNL